MWEQINFAYYIIKNKCTALNLCTVVPLIKPGIVCIHDISYKVNQQFFKTIYLRLSKWWHRLNYYVCFKRCRLIYTVSEYSKRQIQKVYKVKPEVIHILYNGYQHFLRVKEDESVFLKYKNLKKNMYFFSLGSLAPNKNIEWILNCAQYNKKYTFVVSGNKSIDYNSTKDNVIFTGFIKDEEVKALMKHCRAFLFPSKFEGFGIPPLEAMSVGAKAIVSNASCLPEIYEDSVYYINPDKSRISLDRLMKKNVKCPDNILKKYSYKRSAQILIKDLKEYLEK